MKIWVQVVIAGCAFVCGIVVSGFLQPSSENNSKGTKIDVTSTGAKTQGVRDSQVPVSQNGTDSAIPNDQNDGVVLPLEQFNNLVFLRPEAKGVGIPICRMLGIGDPERKELNRIIREAKAGIDEFQIHHAEVGLDEENRVARLHIPSPMRSDRSAFEDRIRTILTPQQAALLLPELESAYATPTQRFGETALDFEFKYGDNGQIPVIMKVTGRLPSGEVISQSQLGLDYASVGSGTSVISSIPWEFSHMLRLTDHGVEWVPH